MPEIDIETWIFRLLGPCCVEWDGYRVKRTRLRASPGPQENSNQNKQSKIAVKNSNQQIATTTSNSLRSARSHQPIVGEVLYGKQLR